MIEVLVAVLLFSLGALVVMTTTMTSYRVNDQARSLGCGTNLGQASMEWLLSLDYDSANLNDVNGDGVSGLLDVGTSADYRHTAAGYPFTDTTMFDPDENPCFRFTRNQVSWNVARNSPVTGTKTFSVLVTRETSNGPKSAVFQAIRLE